MVAPLVPADTNRELTRLLIGLLESFEQRLPFLDLFLQKGPCFSPELPVVLRGEPVRPSSLLGNTLFRNRIHVVDSRAHHTGSLEESDVSESCAIV